MAGKLRKTQVGVVAEKVMDWGNLVFTGLVIGQLVPGSTPVRWFLFLLGILCMMGAYTIAYYLMKGGK
jgi:hypothetical protein